MLIKSLSWGGRAALYNERCFKRGLYAAHLLMNQLLLLCEMLDRNLERGGMVRLSVHERRLSDSLTDRSLNPDAPFLLYMS